MNELNKKLIFWRIMLFLIALGGISYVVKIFRDAVIQIVVIPVVKKLKRCSATISTASFQQRNRFITGHMELHPVSGRDVQRKHLRIDLRRADRLVPHQCL